MAANRGVALRNRRRMQARHDRPSRECAGPDGPVATTRSRAASTGRHRRAACRPWNDAIVATVTRLTEAASTVHYFEADGYYAKNDVEYRKASRWHGRGIAAMGYATEQTMVGSVPGFEIAGYDKATLKAFSTRRAQALAWARERNLDERSAAIMQQAVLYTRKRKDEPSREELSNI